MMKNMVKLECVISDKSYNLLCENDSPLVHLKEALFEFSKYVGKIEDQIKAAQEQQAQSEKLVEEPKAEEIKAE